MIQQWIEYIRKKRAKLKQAIEYGPVVIDLKRRELFTSEDEKEFTSNDATRLLIRRGGGSTVTAD